MIYESVIGLEVHLQLNTKTKVFCGCSTEFGSQPNTQVCPVCLGFPGSLPVLNRTVLEYAMRVGLALNCQVQEYTKLDRKNYFYPDLPKAYQISQYDLPLCRRGSLTVFIGAHQKEVGITRVHMEEDAGKLVHRGEYSCVDFNRAGVPLLEIVSEPDLRSAEEAYEYLTSLKSVMEYLDVSDCDMEKGSLRCDANASIRPCGEQALGTKTELKNLNSFRAVRDALAFEIERQKTVLDAGQKVVQETRLWDARAQVTVSMRTKEEAQDYRYFPEPDLPPFIISREMIERAAGSIPELPRQRRDRLMKEFGLSEYEAGILVGRKEDADYAQECMKLYPQPNKKTLVNWLIGPMLAEANARGCPIAGLGIPAEGLLSLLGYLDRCELSNLAAKSVFSEMIAGSGSADKIIQEKNLIQISDASHLEGIIEEVVRENEKSVNDFKSGTENALMFLVGQAMKKSKGKANPKVVGEMLKRRLS